MCSINWTLTTSSPCSGRLPAGTCGGGLRHHAVDCSCCRGVHAGAEGEQADNAAGCCPAAVAADACACVCSVYVHSLVPVSTGTLILVCA